MSQESKRTYTIRLPEAVAARVEKQAAISGIAPTTLIQSLVVNTCCARRNGGWRPRFQPDRQLDLSAKPATARTDAAERYTRLLFEVVKTRSAFLMRSTRA